MKREEKNVFCKNGTNSWNTRSELKSRGYHTTNLKLFILKKKISIASPFEQYFMKKHIISSDNVPNALVTSKH